MKKSTFLALFIATNIGFVLLHLHKQSQFIHLSYTKQKIELERCNLCKQKQELTHQLYTLYDRTRVLNFAKKELNMTQARVGQFKKINPPALAQADTDAGNCVSICIDIPDEQPLSNEPIASACLPIEEEKNIPLIQAESIEYDACT